MKPVEVKMSKPERRTIEILIDGQVVRTMGCTVSYQIDGEVSWLSRMKFDEPVNIQGGEELSYRFVGEEGECGCESPGMAKAIDAMFKALKHGKTASSEMAAMIDSEWKLKEMAKALARISTYTGQEALDALRAALCELENSEGACAQAAKAKQESDEARYIVSSDLAKLRIARAAIADTMPECWTDLPTYKLEQLKTNVLSQLSTLNAEASRIVGEQTKEDHDGQEPTRG